MFKYKSRVINFHSPTSKKMYLASEMKNALEYSVNVHVSGELLKAVCYWEGGNCCRNS